jgi:lipid A ethanolaminephosphotransferase
MNRIVPTLTTKPRWELHFDSPAGFALLAAATFVAFFNDRFWMETARIFWHGKTSDGLFLLSLSFLMLMLHATALALVPGRRTMQVVAGLLFPIGSMAAYCADMYGVVIDHQMIRNFTETDRREVVPLLNWQLALYVIVLGMLPVLLVARSRLMPIEPRKDLRQRLVLAGITLITAGAVYLGFSSQLLSLVMSHKTLHYLLVPGATVQAGAGYLHAGTLAALHRKSGPDLSAGMGFGTGTDPGSSSRTAALRPQRRAWPQGSRPLLVFFVIGETARHRNFQLGGYQRQTNPALSAIGNVFYFTNVEACATSTAVSVPCMLSPLGRNGLGKGGKDSSGYATGTLLQAGVDVMWRSNNTGGKEVNAGLETLHFEDRPPSALCDRESCLDEILFEGLEDEAKSRVNDTLMVFHQIGSHGPAYRARYPRQMEFFKPTCDTNDLSRCDRDALVNTYDNTIRYTDRLLADKIGLLERLSDRFDTALVYVSDHGESLGENGLYLHSAPYAIAPPEQKRIPMLMWMSSRYMKRFGLDSDCLRNIRDLPFSHDNIYHTLVGAMGIDAPQYRGSLDVNARCRHDTTDINDTDDHPVPARSSLKK